MRNADRSWAAFEEAIFFFGGLGATARALDISYGALLAARKRGRLSGASSRRVHELTGGIIHRESLRPDLFPTRYERMNIWLEIIRLLNAADRP